MLLLSYNIYSTEEAFNSLSGSYKSNLEANIAGFKKLNEMIAEGKSFDDALKSGRKAFEDKRSKFNYVIFQKSPKPS